MADPGMFRQSDKDQMVSALLESAAQAILSVDVSGRIVLANQRTEEMFHYNRNELLGAGIEMLVPAAQRESHHRSRENYFKQPRVRPMGSGMELAGRRKDGSEFPVEVSLSYVRTGDGVFAIAFVSDISQRKKLEEQLMQSQKMEAVGRLAGGVAHDFNNMLTVISGYSRMILDELPGEHPLREYAEEALHAAERAAALTNQLLAFSRRQIIRPRVVNVNELVAQTEKMLRRLIGEDIELILGLAPDVGNIKVDPGPVEQAIVNLAVNSRDAMPTGGQIHIETANVYLDETYAQSHLAVQPGDFVMIAVSDTGHGMDAATRRHLFEPFFTTKEKGRGSGLGLATVYGMVKQTGGDIWVYSEPGKGTTFKLYFPRVKEGADVGGESSGHLKRKTGETLLVVEDENSVRDLTVKMLKQLGYDVLAAGSGEEALEISATFTGSIAMLVTDVVMPRMSGRQVADSLAASRPDMRVLFLSGYTANAVVHHGVLDSDVEYLPKPFSRDALGGKIREVLERGRGRSND